MKIIGLAKFVAIALIGLRSIIPLCTLVAVGRATDAAGNAENSAALPPAERILQCVQRFTGLDASFTISRTESVVVAECLPYLQAPLGKAKGLRVRLAPGKVKWGKPFTKEDTFTRQFTVYLDSDAKQVYAITSQAVVSAKHTPEAVTKLFDWSAARITDVVPTVAPKITFFEAVKSCTAGVPTEALEINGYYRMATGPLVNNGPSCPAWVIEMHGLPEMGIPMSVPVGVEVKPGNLRRGHTQDVIDATTGMAMAAASSISGAPWPEVGTRVDGR